MRKLVSTSVFVSALALASFSPLGISNQSVQADPHAQKSHSEDLEIGSGHLPETRESQTLAEGVTYTQIARGYHSDKSYYTIDVGFFKSKEKAQTLRKSLKEEGFTADLHQVKNKTRKFTDVDTDKIGYVVRAGHFETKDQAEEMLEKVEDHGYEGAGITFSEYDGTTKTTGPWNIHVIEINPEHFEGELTSVLADGQVAGREKVSSMASRTEAIAGINGGYFVFSERDGVPGDPAGISVINGELISEAVGNRTGLVLTNHRADIAEISTELSVSTANGEKAVIDGMNREPGLIRSCGGVDEHSEVKPKHDVTCTDAEEMILFTSMFGKRTPEGSGYEMLISETGEVLETYDQRGHEIPEKGYMLSATGEKAEWLRSTVQKGQLVDVNKNISKDGEKIDLSADMDIIGGGPKLLENGEITIEAKEEGFQWSNDFYYHFAQYRHPRTLAGVKENGNILLVTVDGRNPNESIGISFYEGAKLLQSLGAVEGMNLDGGGSSTMIVNDQVVNDPSDATGERPVSDGIMIIK